MTRVLVCAASPAFVAALRRLLEHDGTISVVAGRGRPEATIAAARSLQADLVVVDTDLPDGGCIAVVEHLMATRPLPILVVAEGAAARAAIAAGALDTVPRSDLVLEDPAGSAAAALRRRICRLSRMRVIHHPRARLRAQPASPVLPRRVEAIGVVASTGGPQALRCILSRLAPTFSVPILVVQHMATGFTRSFGEWLRTSSLLPVHLVEQPTPLGPGVWIAPEGGHLVVSGGGMRVDAGAPRALHTPSGDVLFDSLAASCGAGAVAVVLSGMGSDGARGARSLREAGGFAIAQDESTSAIFGMPRVAAADGVDLVLPVDEIAPTLERLAVPS